jgi:hypothetical protein
MLTTPMTFAAQLSASLEKDARALPLTPADTDKLKALVREDDYTYLVLREPTGSEIIKVEHTCGGLLITRGEDHTEPRKFPRGTCVRFEMTPAVVKDMICTVDCCSGECECNAVAAAGITLPAAKVGVPWSGTAVFTGDTPMELAVVGQPAWVTVGVGANYLRLEGTPTGKGSFSIAVTATNCSGSLAIQQGVLTITE